MRLFYPIHERALSYFTRLLCRFSNRYAVLDQGQRFYTRRCRPVAVGGRIPGRTGDFLCRSRHVVVDKERAREEVASLCELYQTPAVQRRHTCRTASLIPQPLDIFSAGPPIFYQRRALEHLNYHTCSFQATN